jgi:ADP-ribose pyrophosphatase YjhB (NUDIX family)
MTRQMINLRTPFGRFNYRIVGVAMRGEEEQDQCEVLLHRAVTDDFWALPGGRAELLEPADATLRREMREELGVELRELREAGRIEVSGHGKRTVLVCFLARVDVRAPLRLAHAEIAAARWAQPEAPPRPLGADAGAVLALLERPVEPE